MTRQLEPVNFLLKKLLPRVCEPHTSLHNNKEGRLVVICVASTYRQIAALNLEGGWTSQRMIRLNLMNTSTIFGGKTILMSSDWRQTSPTLFGQRLTDIVDAAFISSHLWAVTSSMRLTISQRDKTDAAYWSFVRRVGEGAIPLQTFPDGEQLMMPLSNASSEDNRQRCRTTHG